MKRYITNILPANAQAETKLGRWYPMFRLTGNTEVGYCGSYLISVNRNSVSGYPFSFVFILTMSHSTKIDGHILSYGPGFSSTHNQISSIRIRVAGAYRYIEGYISEGGDPSNTYYCTLSVLNERQITGISGSILSYNYPEPLDENYTGSIYFERNLIDDDPGMYIANRQIGQYGLGSATFENNYKCVWTIRNYNQNPYLFIQTNYDETILWIFVQFCNGMSDAYQRHPAIECIQITLREQSSISHCNIYSDEYSPVLSAVNVKQTSTNRVFTRIASPGYWFSYVLISSGGIRPFVDIGDYTVIEEPTE